MSVSEETLFEIQDICIKKGIKKVNAMFYYMDPEVEVTEKNKLKRTNFIMNYTILESLIQIYNNLIP